MLVVAVVFLPLERLLTLRPARVLRPGAHQKRGGEERPQLGYPAAYESPLAGLLQFTDGGPARGFVPRFINVPAFDPNPMRDIQSWLASDGAGVVFTYGELDPWTASQFDLGASLDTFKAIAPGGNHVALLLSLTFVNQETAMQKVERWLGIRRTFLQPEENLGPLLESRLDLLKLPPMPLQKPIRAPGRAALLRQGTLAGAQPIRASRPGSSTARP